MNTSLIAFLRGYTRFRVNQFTFLTYNEANKLVEQLIRADMPVIFRGKHWRRGWELFYVRHSSTPKPKRPEVKYNDPDDFIDLSGLDGLL